MVLQPQVVAAYLERVPQAEGRRCVCYSKGSQQGEGGSHQPVSYSPCIFATDISCVHTHFFPCTSEINPIELNYHLDLSLAARMQGSPPGLSYTCVGNWAESHISRPSFTTRST